MRRWRWGRALLWLVLCASGHAVAAVPQAPQPRQISVFDGLPSNRVNAIAEDRQGYLWIATRDGLARYDGVGFRTWRVGDGLRENFVWSVHVDGDDRVWVGTQGAGLAMLDVDRQAFVHYDRQSHPAIGDDDIWSVTSTRDGDIWFGTASGGLHRLSGDGRVQRFMPVAGDPRSLPSASVVALVVDRDDALWVGTKAGVARWTGAAFERLPQSALPSPFVDGLVLDRGGDLWIGMQGAGAVRRAGGQIEAMPWLDPVHGQPALHMLVQDARGARWLDTRNGLAWERNGQVFDVPLYSNTSRGRVRPSWAGAYEDREGGLWFASSDAGLWHLPSNWRNFTVLQRRIDDPASPANAYVHGVAPAAADGGRGLWLVGNGGTLDWMDPETGEVEHRLSAVCGSYFSAGVHETRDGHVWIGCFGQLVRFDPRSGGTRRWFADDAADPAPAGMVAQFVPFPGGSLWLAGINGVQLRDAEGRVLDGLRAGDGRGIPRGFAIEQMDRAPDGGLWLAGSAGLLAWNDGARRFEPVPGAPAAELYSFAVDRDGTVWLAGNGVLTGHRWDGERLRPWRTVDAAQGLPAVAPAGVVADATGVLWMTTVRGLLRYDPARDRLRAYGVRDGLPSHEFSEYPIRISPLGYIAAGTADGLLLFHPQHVRWSDRTPTLAIEALDFRRGDARMALRPGVPVELRFDDRDLRVVARLLSFTDAHAHRYRFRLAGYDPDWVDVGSTGERVFARLEPGRYRLEVQARTADDDWTGAQSLELRVLPPWWRTPAAYAGFALLGVLLLLAAARAYRQRLKRRHAWQLDVHKRELAEHASEAKTRFLATLGHEVRTPMTGVLGMSELLLATPLDDRQRSFAESIRRAGEHLMRLVNDALDLARIEAGKLELEVAPFDVRVLAAEVAGLAEPMAARRGLAFHCTVAAGVPQWVAGDRMRVCQVLLNLVNNALKFTEEGSVSLQVSRQGRELRFVVSDTGPGLAEAQRARLFQRFEQADGARTAARHGGSGLGLAICHELTLAMGGRIALESVPGTGTDVIVDLPLPDAQPPAAASVAMPGAGLDLLLVEDDATVAEVMAGLLAAQGHRVVHAPHGLAALAEAASARFDMGLLDLDLPGLDGLALARQLRASGFAGPLLAVTARADADAEPLAREAGFDGFLRKPLTGAMLAAAIAALRPG